MFELGHKPWVGLYAVEVPEAPFVHQGLHCWAVACHIKHTTAHVDWSHHGPPQHVPQLHLSFLPHSVAGCQIEGQVAQTCIHNTPKQQITNSQCLHELHTNSAVVYTEVSGIGPQGIERLPGCSNSVQ